MHSMMMVGRTKVKHLMLCLKKTVIQVTHRHLFKMTRICACKNGFDLHVMRNVTWIELKENVSSFMCANDVIRTDPKIQSFSHILYSLYVYCNLIHLLKFEFL